MGNHHVDPVLSPLGRRRLLLSVGVTCGSKVVPVAFGISRPSGCGDDIDGEQSGQDGIYVQDAVMLKTRSPDSVFLC
jgi:hypothetical protein